LKWHGLESVSKPSVDFKNLFQPPGTANKRHPMRIPPKTEEKALIIGSGIGGLSCAIILARLGFDVTVIEKNRQPGGMLRSYARQGVHCNVGVHYMGALAQGQVLRRCFDYLGITDRLPLIRMGVDGPVDRYHFNGRHPDVETFDLPDGFTAYEDNLKAAFPSQKPQVQALMAMLQRSARHLDQLDFLYSEQPADFWIEQSESLGTIFDQLDCSPGLRAVFGMPSVLIGVPPAVCPQFYHTVALASYLFSAWRLEHHGAHMADVCADRLAALGGRLRTGRAVKHIRTAGGRVLGVTLDSGEQLDAPLVVGAIHPKAIVELLDPDSVKASYRRRILGLTDTAGMVAVHALVPAEKHPAISHNVFSIETESDGAIRDLIYLQLRPSGRPEHNLLSLLTSGHEDLWQTWQQTCSGRRGPDYEHTKNELAHDLIAGIEKITGPFSGMKIIDVYTPLTIRDWVGSPNGSAYGVMRSTDQLMSAALLNRTALRGLFLAGQSVLAPGILGTILGSLTTVQFIVGSERFRREVQL
jgi:all-trans-retinol 13,14-reductase